MSSSRQSSQAQLAPSGLIEETTHGASQAEGNMSNSNPTQEPSPNVHIINMDGENVRPSTQKQEKETTEVKRQNQEGWSSSDNFHYPMPTLDNHREDPWEYCYNLAKQKDKEKCERSKDEIEKLLIFAGLFSAVVTAFTIESYKWLQEDPADISNKLLIEISAKLSNIQPAPGLNTAAGSSALKSTFQPDLWTIRVNSLWFISLILALAVAVMGILGLQWIREFQGTISLPPRDAFIFRCIRWNGFRSWHVLETISILPLILQISLVIFLLGIVDFLWHQNSVVAISASVMVGLIVALLLLTTVMPAFQYILTLDRYLQIPQCPFKSTQSMFFFRLLVLVLKPVAIVLLLLDSAKGIWASLTKKEELSLWSVIEFQMALCNPPSFFKAPRRSWRYTFGKVLFFPETSGEWWKMDEMWLERRSHMLKNDTIALDRHDITEGLNSLCTTAIAQFYKGRCLNDLKSHPDERRFLSAALVDLQIQTIAEINALTKPEITKRFPDDYVADYLSRELLIRYPAKSMEDAELQRYLNHFFELNIRLLNGDYDLFVMDTPDWMDDDRPVRYIMPDDIMTEFVRILQHALAKDLGSLQSHLLKQIWLLLGVCLQVLWNSDPEDWIHKPYAQSLVEILMATEKFLDQECSSDQWGLSWFFFSAIINAAPKFSEELNSRHLIFRQLLSFKDNLPTLEEIQELIAENPSELILQYAHDFFTQWRYLGRILSGFRIQPRNNTEDHMEDQTPVESSPSHEISVGVDEGMDAVQVQAIEKSTQAS